MRYASNGRDKIHFISTNRLPRDFPNSVYPGYVSNGQLFNTDGTLMDTNLFDNTAVAPNELTPIFNNGR